MAYLLHIETAVSSSSIALSEDNRLIDFRSSTEIKDSASWIHIAINELFKVNNIPFTNIAAISVSAGPGSYTGLRVGMATAKGLCYALNIPLILISTLKLMASAAIDKTGSLLCPMIDARRMEVFTALYDQDLKEILSPVNLVLDNNSFSDYLSYSKILFFGNGSDKFQPLLNNSNAIFMSVEFDARTMVNLANQSYINQEFSDLAYSEPYYVKDFYTVQKTQ